MKHSNITVEGSDHLCPENILLCDDHKELCSWLCICVTELRIEDGNPYTPRSIANFVSGLQQYISKQKSVPVRLVDPENLSFKELHRAANFTDVTSSVIDRVEYCEHGSKNCPGGRHQLNLENKVVVQFAKPGE